SVVIGQGDDALARRPMRQRAAKKLIGGLFDQLVSDEGGDGQNRRNRQDAQRPQCEARTSCWARRIFWRNEAGPNARNALTIFSKRGSARAVLWSLSRSGVGLLGLR